MQANIENYKENIIVTDLFTKIFRLMSESNKIILISNQNYKSYAATSAGRGQRNSQLYLQYEIIKTTANHNSSVL